MFVVIVTGDGALAEAARAFAAQARVTVTITSDEWKVASVLRTILPDLVIVDERHVPAVDVARLAEPRAEWLRLARVTGLETAMTALRASARRTAVSRAIRRKRQHAIAPQRT